MIPRSDFEEAEKSGVVELGVFKWVSLRMMERWRVGCFSYAPIGLVYGIQENGVVIFWRQFH